MSLTPDQIRQAWLAPYTEPANYMLDPGAPCEIRHELLTLRLFGRDRTWQLRQTRVYSYSAVRKALTCRGITHNVMPLPRMLRRYLPPLVNGPVTQPRGRRHRRLRGLFEQVVNGSAVAELAPQITQLAERLVWEAATRGKEFEFNRLTDEVTYFAICKLLGVDDELRTPEHRQLFFAWLDELMKASSPFNLGRAEEAMRFFDDYIDRRLALKLNEPIDKLLRAKGLRRFEILAQILFYFISATATTSQGICSAIAGMKSIDHKQFERIRQAADSDRAVSVLNRLYQEALRYAGPSRLRPLLVYWPVRLDGEWYWPGQVVEVCFASANRDKRFVDPDTFNPERPAIEHLAFGADPVRPAGHKAESYKCPGQGLSSIVARAMLGAWFQHLADWEIRELEFRGKMLLRPYLVLGLPD